MTSTPGRSTPGHSTPGHSPPGQRTIPYRLKRRPEERVTLLGAQVDLVRPEEMLLFVAARIRAGMTTLVGHHTLHSLSHMRQAPELRAFYEAADLVEVQSLPMVLWGRLLGLPIRGFHRSAYPDWRDTFWRTAVEARWRVFYLGGAAGVSEAGAARVRQDFPSAEIDGHPGEVDLSPGSAGQAAVMAKIAAFRPHVVLVGLGMPHQEIWIERHAQALSGVALLSVGPAFEAEAAACRAPPRWLARIGLAGLDGRLGRSARQVKPAPVKPDPVQVWSLARLAAADLRRALLRRRVAKPGPTLRTEP